MDVRSKDERGPAAYCRGERRAPVLLLHGWPQHWWCWRRVIEQLRGRYHLLVPDLRGFGWSEASGKGYSAATFARDAVGLLDALDIDRAHVVGHDWGGFTGFLLGLEHPSRIDRLLLCNTPGPWARLNPRVAIGLRRAWYVPLVAAPVLGERMVARRGFVQMVSAAGWPGGAVPRRGCIALRRPIPRFRPRRGGITAVPVLPSAGGASGPAAPPLCRPAAQRSNPAAVRRMGDCQIILIMRFLAASCRQEPRARCRPGFPSAPPGEL